MLGLQSTNYPNLCEYKVLDVVVEGESHGYPLNWREYAAPDNVGRVLVTSQPIGNESYRYAKLVGGATYASVI